VGVTDAAADMDVIVAAARTLSTATAHEAAGRIGALPAAITPLAPAMRVCGPALPVRAPAGDNLFLHHALYAASPGEVLVVDTTGGVEFGYWGEVMALAAQVRGLAGLVIAGGVRDSLRMIEMGFPVFSVGTCIRGTAKDPHGAGTIGAPVMIGDVTIRRGDMILGDADGVLALPADQAAAVVAQSHRRDAEEQTIFDRLRAGATTLEIYALPEIVSGNASVPSVTRCLNSRGDIPNRELKAREK